VGANRSKLNLDECFGIGKLEMNVKKKRVRKGKEMEWNSLQKL